MGSIGGVLVLVVSAVSELVPLKNLQVTWLGVTFRDASSCYTVITKGAGLYRQIRQLLSGSSVRRNAWLIMFVVLKWFVVWLVLAGV